MASFGDGGVSCICAFCGEMVSGSTREEVTQKAEELRWGRYIHHSFDGERWVCPKCCSRHTVIKRKTSLW